MRASSVSVTTPGSSSATSFTRHTSFATGSPSSVSPHPSPTASAPTSLHTLTANRPAAPATDPVVVGLDGGYVRNRHRAEGRRFEVIAGQVIQADGNQHRFAFPRTGLIATTEAFRAALAAAGVGADTPATVLCDGDAGLWRLQRGVLPGATVVLDWWHAAVRFEHALQAARSLGAGTADACLAEAAVRGLERTKWRLWHGRRPGGRGKLGALCRWAEREPLGGTRGHARGGRHWQAAPARVLARI